MYDAKVLARFWAKVDRSGGPDACWPWTGAKKRTGYGNFCVERPNQHTGKWVNAHKFAYQAVNGTVADGLFVCHRCDNPSCCNPAHLFTGTGQENARDAITKGRLDPAANGRVFGPRGGQANGKRLARLTDEQVREVIALSDQGVSGGEIARRYKVSATIIHGLLRGERYTWLPEVQARRKQ